MRRRVWSGQQMTIGRSSYTQWEREIRWDTKDLLSFFFSLFELTSQVNRLLHYGLIYLFFSLSQLGRREKPKSMTCRDLCRGGRISLPSRVRDKFCRLARSMQSVNLRAPKLKKNSGNEDKRRIWREKKKQLFFFTQNIHRQLYVRHCLLTGERERRNMAHQESLRSSWLYVTKEAHLQFQQLLLLLMWIL